MTVSPKLKIIAEDLLVYGVAAGVVWYEARGVSYRKELHDLADVNLWLFVLATLASFLIWFLGENLLFARLFTHFHKRTRYLEMLPGTAAAYFLQAVNVLLADAALMVFLHHRKQVPWLASGFTMAFFGFIDGIVFAFVITVAGLAVTDSPVRAYVPYSAAALIGFFSIAAWWRWRKPQLKIEQWFYNRPSLVAFRKATPAIYRELILIRFLIIAPQGVLLWLSFSAFKLHIPLVQVWTGSPIILAASAMPFTPAGLGPMQAMTVHFFARSAPEAKVLAAALAFGIAQLVYRLPLGIGSPGVFVHIVLESGGLPEEQPETEDDKSGKRPYSNSPAIAPQRRAGSGR